MGQCQGNSSAENFKPIIEDIPGTKQPGFSSVYRKVGVTQLQWRPIPQLSTIIDLFDNTVKQHPSRPAIGYVNVKSDKNAKGEDVETREVKSLTYRELYDSAFDLGKGILHRNFTYHESLYGMEFVGVYSKNRYEWFMFDWACVLFGITSVPLYDTLGFQNLTYCLNQTQMTTLFVSGSNVKNLIKLEDIGNLKHLVLFDMIDAQTQIELQNKNLSYVFFKDLIKEGSETNITNNHVKTQPESCFTFCYTSGTTGPPKGAMISHKNMLAFIRSFDQHSEFHMNETDVYPSYLPLPHLMERCVSLVLFFYGGAMICTCGDVLKLKDDCQAIKPTFLLSVPRLYNRIVDSVKSKFEKESGIKKMLIDKGVNTKLGNLQHNGNYHSAFYDKVVFSKVKEGFGGRVRMMGSGSAPLSPETHEYMMAIMACPLIEGYGQTQSSAAVLYSSTRDTTHGRFSQISETVELKTSDIPEMKYTADDKDERGLVNPRGELWVRGPHVFMGYYKQPDLTSEAITPDGWLKTGDIVQVFPEYNSFKIIDRKKNIFKLQQGQYVAPEKVEHAYGKMGILNPSEIFLHGDSSKNFSVLITTPLKDHMLQYMKQHKFDGSNYEGTLNDRKFREYFLKDLNNFGKKEGLNGFQVAKNIYFEPQGFVGKGFLTSTMKLMRFDAKTYYKQRIEEMYAEGDILLK